MSLLLSVHLSVFCASFFGLLCSFCNVVGSVVVAMVLVVTCWCGSPFIQPSQHWKRSLAMSEGLYSCLIQSHADTFPHATHIHCHCHRHTLWYHCTWLFWPGCVCSWLCCVWGCLLVRFSVFRPIVTFRLTFFTFLFLPIHPLCSSWQSRQPILLSSQRSWRKKSGKKQSCLPSSWNWKASWGRVIVKSQLWVDHVTKGVWLWSYGCEFVVLLRVCDCEVTSCEFVVSLRVCDCEVTIVKLWLWVGRVTEGVGLWSYNCDLVVSLRTCDCEVMSVSWSCHWECGREVTIMCWSCHFCVLHLCEAVFCVMGLDSSVGRVVDRKAWCNTNTGSAVITGDCFYIALFSALKQTVCALVACDSKWASVPF